MSCDTLDYVTTTELFILLKGTKIHYFVNYKVAKNS